jgi:hypothetical protein
MRNYIFLSISCQLWNIVLEYPTNACSSVCHICQPLKKFDAVLLTLGAIKALWLLYASHYLAVIIQNVSNNIRNKERQFSWSSLDI